MPVVTFSCRFPWWLLRCLTFYFSSSYVTYTDFPSTASNIKLNNSVFSIGTRKLELSILNGKSSSKLSLQTKFLLPSCSEILNKWHSSSCSQNGCCASRHHIFIPGSKREGGKGQKECASWVWYFLLREEQLLQNPHPQFFIEQNCVTWSPLARRQPGKLKFSSGHMAAQPT